MSPRREREVPTIGDDEPESGSVRIARNAARLERDRDMDPLEGAVEVSIACEVLWDRLADARRWPEWIDAIAWARASASLTEGARIWIGFRSAPSLPVPFRVVQWRPGEGIAFELRAPGLHWRHAWRVEAAGEGRARLSSWDLARGAVFRRFRGRLMARLEAMRASSLQGARELARRSAGGGVPL
ncbi:MAG: SRPBCC family protein [Myxococcales bacterium]|nr:SRPBCC family protein [Myxococcales bacterium]